MSSGIYSTSKLMQHRAALEQMAKGQHLEAPIIIDFMPMLACNQSCQFCAYGHRQEGDDRDGWKNMQLMSDASLPVEKMRELVADWQRMGVRAVELTGGGEPLIWPHVDEFLVLLSETDIELGLVTNGTALTEARGDLIADTHWRWARVSIDAGEEADYVRTRRVPRTHWTLAWRAVELLAGYAVRRGGECSARVGVGFVVDNTNFNSVYRACARARDAGADNIRVTLAFSPNGLDLFELGVLEEARAQASAAAADLTHSDFEIHDLIQERSQNLVAAAQDYPYCGMKEVRCVVGGDQNVYTCCSLAFNEKGLVGSIAEQSFKALWQSQETHAFFDLHDPRKICNVECLYEQRNRSILSMLGGLKAPHGMFV